MKLRLLVACAVVMLAAACGSARATEPSGGARREVVVTIEADTAVGFFSPAVTQVQPGGAVRFENLTLFPHNAIFGDVTIADSTLFGDGESYVVKIPADTADGLYTYVCTLHPGMSGTLDVQR